jgi:hypothetical protein
MSGLNKTKRNNVTTVVTHQDFKNFIEAHYGPTVANTIETLVSHALAKEEKKRQLSEMQGLVYETSFCEVRCYKAIACRYINQMVGSAKGPSMIFSSGLDAERDDLAMIISSLNANSAALAAPSASASGPWFRHLCKAKALTQWVLQMPQARPSTMPQQQ